MKISRIVPFLLVICFIKVTLSSECAKRHFGYSSFVCVCNATYCNFDGNRTAFSTDQVKLITTSEYEYRNFEQIVPRQDGTFNSSNVDFSIFVNPNIRRQNIIGYGGAFTDSASITIKSLSDEAQENLLRLYFSPEGSRYNLVRVPIALSDFSTHPYTYDEVEGDVGLIFFNLTVEDYDYKLPLMRRAIELCEDELYIFGSPWSAPTWMKTNKDFNGNGIVPRDLWQTYSNYFVKFFEAYERELGVNLWGFTPQNEPMDGFNPGLRWGTNDMRDWIATTLGPTVEDAGYRRLKLMIVDYNRHTLPWYALPTLNSAAASHYVDGIAVHWYDDTFVGTDTLDLTHEAAQDKFMLYTEACVNGETPDIDVKLGAWDRGERYIIDIIENTNHWSSGWVDWNLALDTIGGPNWVNNFLDAPIIINATADEFYVQPMFYALNMFSRNVDRLADAIYNTVAQDYDHQLRTTAFQNPDGTIVLIIANISDKTYTFGIINENSEYIFKTSIAGRTWMTVVYYA